MIARPSPLGSEHKGLFQMQSADKLTTRVGLFSSVGRISSVDCISSVVLRVVALLGEAEIIPHEITRMRLCAVSGDQVT